MIRSEESEEGFEKEENVDFTSDVQIQFKIILEENGVERKKYLEVDFVNKHMSILRSNNKSIEHSIRFEDIQTLKRSFLDTRSILL